MYSTYLFDGEEPEGLHQLMLYASTQWAERLLVLVLLLLLPSPRPDRSAIAE